MADGTAEQHEAAVSERDEHATTSADESGDDERESEEESDEEDDEPKLKYARMTGNLGAVYRNGDATSCFLVAGDKMFIGTHNGNIHVLSLPSFQSVRVYSAHQASVTSISISPFPPPLPSARPEALSRVATQLQTAPQRPPSSVSTPVGSTRQPRQQQAVPNTISNAIYIATSSIDGNVCIASLVDLKDVQLRNFARPVQAVAISPDFKNDRTYVSGGLAGNLVVTVGGKSGTRSTSTTTGSTSATATGWLNTIGLAGNTGKDNVLHYGEGTITTIKWSLSGKYVVWINEHGIRIMRSHLHLEAIDADSAWKRIGHVSRPQDGQWDEMASLWKGRAEWVDEKKLESDEDDLAREKASSSSPATAKLLKQSSRGKDNIEKLLVGWGDALWIINVYPGGTGIGKHVGERTVGRAEVVKFLRMDCIISGLSLYTPTLLIVLAYTPPTDNEEVVEEPAKGHKSKTSVTSTGSEPRGGIRHRQNAKSPELRLIDLASSEEVDSDTLTVSRFERLSATDYHLGVLPALQDVVVPQTSRGTLEALAGMGSGMWNATISAGALLSSAASIRSTGSGESGSQAPSIAAVLGQAREAHPNAAAPGMKIFIHSPYDCILAIKRDLADHLNWLLEHQKYQQSWELVDEHPEVISASPERLADIGPGSPDGRQLHGHGDDFYDDESTTESASNLINSAVEKEKRRIGELWIQEVIESGDWKTAGEVCGKVLGTSTRWEHWVWTFAGANKFEEITPFIPTTQIQPPLPSTIYEVVLGHYIAQNRLKMRQLLEQWPPELFDIKAVTTALENQLTYRDVREDSIEDGVRGRDWHIVMESLGKLYAADGHPREALKCYIKLQDADSAMALIKEHHLLDTVADDIPSLILLRVSKEQERSASIEELEAATSEAVSLLVDEAHHGLVRPEVVISQLRAKGMTLYLFFYIRSLWRGEGISEDSIQNRDRLLVESKGLVDEFADLAIELFATYDRTLLMEFLKASTFYTFEKASQVCEERDFIPELVYLYSKTGQTKRALFLIIDKLADVSQAISFAKEQDDPDLWEDLLNYSMDKPRFIRGLLEEVGTSINPITLVRRIPEGLEIEGLREGLSRMIKEYEIQHSISQGVACVLRGEVATAQGTLRSGQRRGVKFDVHHRSPDHVDIATNMSVISDDDPTTPAATHTPKSGHCVGCHEAFHDQETETLIGFACGHVFHLSHLLDFVGDRRPMTPPEVGLDEHGEYSVTHSVGGKVTHARLLRDRIMGGCPVCKVA